MSDQALEFCPADRLDHAADLAMANADQGLAAVAELLADFPRDPRLPYLEGSILLAAGRHGEAAEALAGAVALEPAFGVARFQLGFLRMMHGDAFAATETWGPLLVLAAEDPLRLFAEGFFHLVRDEVDTAKTLLEAGLRRNAGHEALNREIRLVLEILAETAGKGEDAAARLFDEARRRTGH